MIKQAIQKAIEGGYSPSGRTWKARQVHRILLDPLFWQSLGKALGWGEWTIKLEDIEHRWELEKYLPDTGKTPVYNCKDCYARKINNVIETEEEYEWYEIKPNHWTARHLIQKHGGYKKQTWKEYWHRFIDHLAENKDPEEFFKELLK